jgi:hypothetical protein
VYQWSEASRDFMEALNTGIQCMKCTPSNQIVALTLNLDSLKARRTVWLMSTRGYSKDTSSLGAILIPSR